MSNDNWDFWYSEFHSPKGDVKFSLKVDEVLYSEETPFQKIVFMKNQTFGTFFTLDGFIMVTEKDEFIYHDMICHPALAVNPEISRVLIIGGGDGGSAREVAKYQGVEKIDLVEIDERVVHLCQKYMPQTAAVLDSDPRINLYFQDGVRFVAEAKANSYDLILVDSTDPIGPGEGLFSLDFYQNCQRILSSQGILINQHEGAFYDGDVNELERAHSKLKKTFPVAKLYGFNIPSYASGYWYFGFASKGLDPLADLRPDKWQVQKISTKYYNPDIHKASFQLPNYVLKLLNPLIM